MKLAIMQPYFFPYLGYFQLINAVDKYIIYDNLNFIKDAWVNRNRILVKNTGVTMITVPLMHKNSYTKIQDVEIDNSKKWRDKLKKTICINYNKSPMFEEVYPILEALINYPTDKLSELNSNIILALCNYLKINTVIEINSFRYQHIENLLLNKKYIFENYGDIENKVIRIFEICRQEHAYTFYNAIGGIRLYDKDLFAKNNIQIKFIKTKDINYMQYKNDFIPDLSIIDVLMFNGIDKIREMLYKFELI